MRLEVNSNCNSLKYLPKEIMEQTLSPSSTYPGGCNCWNRKNILVVRVVFSSFSSALNIPDELEPYYSLQFYPSHHCYAPTNLPKRWTMLLVLKTSNRTNPFVIMQSYWTSVLPKTQTKTQLLTKLSDNLKLKFYALILFVP